MGEERRTAYEILQVREEADQVVLQAAYRALAAVYHPDLNAAPEAERRMAELNDAYAVVRSAEQRAAYDRLRKTPNIRDARAAPAPIVTPPPSRATPGDGSALLDFGRYSGWSLPIWPATTRTTCAGSAGTPPAFAIAAASSGCSRTRSSRPHRNENAPGGSRSRPASANLCAAGNQDARGAHRA